MTDPSPATPAAAATPPAEAALHSSIMNLPTRNPYGSDRERRAYFVGHRDARHDAAELASQALAPAPVAPPADGTTGTAGDSAAIVVKVTPERAARFKADWDAAWGDYVPKSDYDALAAERDAAKAEAAGMLDRLERAEAEAKGLRAAMERIAGLPWNVVGPVAFDNLCTATRIACAAIAAAPATGTAEDTKGSDHART